MISENFFSLWTFQRWSLFSWRADSIPASTSLCHV